MSDQILVMGARNGAFLLTEANGERSRAAITLAATEVALPSGQVLGKLASGEHVPYNAAGTDGSETAVAVLYIGKPASEVAQPAAAVVRDAEVVEDLLVGADAAALADLLAVGIVAQ